MTSFSICLRSDIVWMNGFCLLCSRINLKTIMLLCNARRDVWKLSMVEPWVLSLHILLSLKGLRRFQYSVWSVVFHQVHCHWSLFSPSGLLYPNPPKEHFVLCVVKYTHIFLNNCLFESLVRLLLCLNIQNVIKCHSFSAFLKKSDAVCWRLVLLLQIFLKILYVFVLTLSDSPSAFLYSTVSSAWKSERKRYEL